MKTIAIKIPLEMDARLQSLSHKRGVSKSRIIREAVQASLESDIGAPELSAYDLMKDGLGIVKSDRIDLASNPKHMDGFGQ